MEHTPEKSSPMRHARFAIAEDNNSNAPTVSRPKKPPPITPRRFTKFFTPRPRNAVQAVRTSRRALRSITGPALNSRNKTREHHVEDTDIESMPTIDENQSSRPSRKRKYSTYSAIPSIASSPIKAGGFLSSSQETGPRLEDCTKKLCDEEEADTELEDLQDSSDEEEDEAPPPPSVPYRSISTSASILSTRLTGRLSRKETPKSQAWQDQTASFVSNPEDIYECNTISGHVVLPFCVANCNTNSLIAIGEEEGRIRLIETTEGDKRGFPREFLTMHPHDNAIMDLQFSDDDRLLATASGDQTSQVIDMSTQTSIFCLSAHHSSIKRVQFQPASGNNVLATCSRDGSVNIWDLRSPTLHRPALRLRTVPRPDEVPTRHPHIRHLPASNTIRDAHGTHVNKWNQKNPNAKVNPISGRNDFSVTSLSFIGASRQHMLVTASEAHAVVKLWDMRVAYSNLRRSRPMPISSTAEPPIHVHNRSYGLTSLALGGDGARLYAMCRDNIIYAYSTSHLILGDGSLSSAQPPSKYSNGPDGTGFGPLYGFVHPRLRVATFYPRLAVRKAQDGNTELLAAGSSDDCAVLFPTDERYLTKSTRLSSECSPGVVHIPGATRLYQHGTPLTRAHGKEVTGVAWSSEGNLVTVSDDFSSRCWRENANEARDLRLKGEAGGRRWMMGWAEVYGKEYDDE